jgi:hypothetical protein
MVRRSGRAQGVRDRSVSVLKWYDLYAYSCFDCSYFASAADVRTDILADHIRQLVSITIKKEASNDDDDD